MLQVFPHWDFTCCANSNESLDRCHQDACPCLHHDACRLLHCRSNWITGSPTYITDRLQCILDTVARLVSGTRKYDCGLSSLLHSDLHWLDVLESIQFKLGITVYSCLQNKAPVYLMDCFISTYVKPCVCQCSTKNYFCSRVTDAVSRCHLQSASQYYLTVPRYWYSQIMLTLLAEYLWSTGLLFCWPSNLEHSAGQPL